MIFDTHTHYLSKQFSLDRDALLSELPQKGVCGVVECGTDFVSSKKAIELSEKFSYVYAAAGIHPESLIEDDASTVYLYKGDWERELYDIEALLSHPKCIAIGECGLDYHWPVPKDKQSAMLSAHILLAKKHNMPLILHDREAHADMYSLLDEYKPHAVLHCYSGSSDDAVRFSKSGIYFGFGGASTFKNAKKALEVISALPLEQILLETDCPYMAPEPYRGKRCDSSMIRLVAEKISEIKGIGAEEVLSQTEKNARRFFKI